MPLYLRVPSPEGTRDIFTGNFYDNIEDLKHSGDYPFHEFWVEKGKLYAQFQGGSKPSKYIKTPNKGWFY